MEYTFGHQNGFLSIDKCESSRTSTFETYDRRQIGLSEHRRMRILVDVDVGVPYHTHGAYKRSCSPQEPSLDTRFLHGGQDHTPSAKPLSHDWRPTTLRGVVRRSHSVLMASYSIAPPPTSPCLGTVHDLPLSCMRSTCMLRLRRCAARFFDAEATGPRPRVEAGMLLMD